MSTETKDAQASVRPTGHYELKGRGKLEISKALATQIDELHREIGNLEWSGILVYRVINGDINKPDDFHVIAEGLLPMNVGSSGYTEYDGDASVLEVYDHYPKLDPEDNTRNIWRIGQIHTHHSMGAYFSSTDIDELRENAGKYPYYLSLIVDTKLTYKAKIAFVAQKAVSSTTKLTFSAGAGKRLRNIFQREKKNETMLVSFDLDVDFQNEDWFKDKIKALKGASSKNYSSSGSNNYNSRLHTGESHRQMGFSQGGLHSSKNAEETETKSISSMADREFGNKIREASVKLLEIPGKPLLATENWYLIFNSLLAMCIDDVAIADHVRTIKGRLDGWLAEEFKSELYSGKDEEDVILKFMSLVNCYSPRNKVASSLVDMLRAKYVEIQKVGAKKDVDDDSVEEYYTKQYGNNYGVN